VSRLPRKCVTLNVSQPYRPPWPVTGIALPLPYTASVRDQVSHQNESKKEIIVFIQYSYFHDFRQQTRRQIPQYKDNKFAWKRNSPWKILVVMLTTGPLIKLMKSEQQAGWHSCNTLDSYARGIWFEYTYVGTPAFITVGVCGFPQSLQVNARMVPSHNRFHPNRLQFIINQSSYHSALYSLDTAP
jgi:hypothetical protein